MFGQASKPAGFGGFGTPAPAPAPGGFGFGAQQQPQQQQTSAFGQPAATAASPFGAKPTGAFGGASTTSPFGGFGATTTTGGTGGGGLFGAAPAPAPGTSAFGATPGGGLFGAPAPAPSPFGAPATGTGGGGLFGATTTTTGGFGTAGGGFGTGLAGAGGGGLFGGAAATPFGAQPQQQQQQQQQQALLQMQQQPMTAQQQQQQQLALQRRFWEHELDLIRDTYTPQTAQQPPAPAPAPTGLFGAQALQQPPPPPQRVAEYKFAFRVSDSSTGQPREVLLTDHRMVQAKLQMQQAEMGRVKEHLETLGKSVRALDAQARGAKDRLASCREAQMMLTNRFLLVLQRIQVMHGMNRPFDAREKATRDRLEAMVGRLEDAIRTLNEVAGVVDEEEAGLRDQPRPEMRCNLEPADLELLQAALEKQQQGLDYLTKTLKRDLDGVELLGERLEGGRPTF